MTFMRHCYYDYLLLARNKSIRGIAVRFHKTSFQIQYLCDKNARKVEAILWKTFYQKGALVYISYNMSISMHSQRLVNIARIKPIDKKRVNICAHYLILLINNEK